ncbi:MAG: flagellar protein [Bacillota bacterium]
MEIINCRKCGRAFAYSAGPKICQSCKEKEEDKYEIVKDYLWDNPNASIEKVHQETEVEKELIIKFVKEGRLKSEGLDIELTLKCERCGKKIKEGRFCQDCQKKLVDGLRGKNNSSKKKQKGNEKGMFIRDRINRRKGINDD